VEAAAVSRPESVKVAEPKAEAPKATEVPAAVVDAAAKSIAKAKAEFMAQAEAEAAKIEAQQKAMADAKAKAKEELAAAEAQKAKEAAEAAARKAKEAAEAIAKEKAELTKQAETAAAAAEAIARTKAELSAQAEAASTATPEELAKFAEAIRAANSARTAEMRNATPRAAAARPGVPLEPVAHAAGLHAPVHRNKQRKVMTPGLLFLFALMTFFGLYATGNLPQFDQWTDSVVNSAHAHNDQVVSSVVSGWRMIAYGAASHVLLLIVFMIVNSVRASHSDND
jgi:hypothetical protein